MLLKCRDSLDQGAVGPLHQSVLLARRVVEHAGQFGGFMPRSGWPVPGLLPEENTQPHHHLTDSTQNVAAPADPGGVVPAGSAALVGIR